MANDEGGEGAPRDPIAAAAYGVMCEFRLTNMRDDLGGDYPLVDLMSNDGCPITTGKEQIRELALEVAQAIEPQVARLRDERAAFAKALHRLERWSSCFIETTRITAETLWREFPAAIKHAREVLEPASMQDDTPPDNGVLLLLNEAISMCRRENVAGQHIGAMCNARDEIEKLRAALAFYAKPTNWSVDGTILAASPACDGRPDCGDTARAALEPEPSSDDADIRSEVVEYVADQLNAAIANLHDAVSLLRSLNAERKVLKDELAQAERRIEEAYDEGYKAATDGETDE